jgi:uncharacterized protein HemX
MENINSPEDKSQSTPKPIETDYEKHSDNPGPSRTAVEEKGTNNEGASSVLKWIIPIAIIIGLVVWFVMRK